MLRKATEQEEKYRLDLAREIISNEQGIDADVFDVAQEMVWLGVTQMKKCGATTTDVMQWVKTAAYFIPKSKKH